MAGNIGLKSWAPIWQGYKIARLINHEHAFAGFATVDLAHDLRRAVEEGLPDENVKEMHSKLIDVLWQLSSEHKMFLGALDLHGT